MKYTQSQSISVVLRCAYKYIKTETIINAIGYFTWIVILTYFLKSNAIVKAPQMLSGSDCH